MYIFKLKLLLQIFEILVGQKFKLINFIKIAHSKYKSYPK